MSDMSRPYCPCCGNLSGCDCFGQGSQARRIESLEAQLPRARNEALQLLTDKDGKLKKGCPVCPGCSEANGTEGFAVVRHDPPLCKTSAEQAAIVAASDILA